MPLDASQRTEVFVGRLRRDLTHPRALNMWVVSDNLLKGAATNTVQIAETLIEKRMIIKRRDRHEHSCTEVRRNLRGNR